jgi:hypothetical protein
VQGTAAEFAVSPAPQTITFTSTPPSPAYYGETYTVAATSTSGLPVTFGPAAMSVCTVSGDTVTLTGVGTCTVVATQGGNADYLPATPQSQGIDVLQAPTTLVAYPVSLVGSMLMVSVTFSGTMTSQATGKAIGGQKVTFRDGPLATCSAATDANGVASCTVSVLAVVALLLSPSYIASYAGGPDYLASNATGKVTFL